MKNLLLSFGLVAGMLVASLASTPALSAPAPSPKRVTIDTSCKYPNSIFYRDTLTVIWKPLTTMPTMLRPGDTLTVWANAPNVPTTWSASLEFSSSNVPLTPAGGAYQASLGRWVLGFSVPLGVPEELYDFLLSSDGGLADTTFHSVKVLPAFRSDYYFAQISDTHLPTHVFSSDGSFSTCDTTGMADFDAVIADLNLIHPEFILHTGDLVNEGDLDTLYQANEMGRALGMVYRLHDPMFLSSGNHDIGGFTSTPVPAGTSRRDWWKFFGWPFLIAPPAGDPNHSQNYSFDYDSLHVVALEAYLNYDSWGSAIWGGGSFTTEQLNWLQSDLLAAGSKHKLLMYHFDFDQGANTGSTAGPWQLNIASLGVDGAIWGHYHTVPENSKTLRTAHPFDLGLQSVISNSFGGRTFRIFRVHNGQITPGPMHHSGTTQDSLSIGWSGPNDGSQTALTANMLNLFGESWDHARLRFVLADQGASYTATGGTIAQVIRTGGLAYVYVDFVIPPTAHYTVAVTPVVAGATAPGASRLKLEAPSPNPFLTSAGSLRVRFTLAEAGSARLDVFDLAGRHVANLFEGSAAPGPHEVSWNGVNDAGVAAPSGTYMIRLRQGTRAAHQRLQLLR